MKNDAGRGDAPMARRQWMGRMRYLWTSLAALMAFHVTGCSLDALLHSDELPKNVTDPALTETPTGALQAYYGALAQFRLAFAGRSTQPGVGGPSSSFVAQSGLLSDELQNVQTPGDPRGVDPRILPDGSSDGSYGDLQKARGTASQAIGLLVDYLPGQPALVGHLYAIQGYVEVFLAELYCSGIPLGTLDYHGDFTYKPGSTTEQVFSEAVARFDTALTLAGDSARVMDMARLGRGRALLALGRYQEAAAAVAGVADGYRYNVIYNGGPAGDSTSSWSFARFTDNNGQWWTFSVPDLEGSNGMNWRTSGDPRTRLLARAHPISGLPQLQTIYSPVKYDTAGSTPVVLASGVEARLIEAEAALQSGGGTWLATLNALRTDGTFDVDTQVVAVDMSVTPPDTTFAYDTLWHAGSGGVAGLAPLDDPGTTGGRVDLLFRERAFWLFLTGHRQGDLRRMIRQYGRLQSDLYPVGGYPLGAYPYGSDVTFPVPATESANPLYTGCISRGA